MLKKFLTAKEEIMVRGFLVAPCRVAVIFIFTVLYISPPVFAAKTTMGGGGFGTNFSCDILTNKCTCEGSALGADCRAMAKNCKGAEKQKDGSYKNIVLECKTEACKFRECEMSRKVPSRKPTSPVITTPSGGVIAPTKNKPNNRWPPKSGTIMKTVPMKQYKMAPVKQK